MTSPDRSTPHDPVRSAFARSHRRRADQPAKLALGMAALGRPGYITTGHGEQIADPSRPAMQAHALAMLDLAYENGVRYVDTARSYGAGEAFVGHWLETRQHDDVTVASKWGYEYVADWRVDADVHEVKDHSIEMFRRQRAQTAHHLGSQLSLYQIHSVTPDSPVLGDEEVLSELAGLRADGVAIGLSTSGPDQAPVIDRAREVAVDGVRLFDAVQTTWNLLERSAEDALVRARNEGMVVVVKEALANGRLTPDGDRGGQVSPGTEAPDAAALSAAANGGFADVVLLGVVTAAHLRSNLRALEVEPAEQPAAMDPQTYWDERGERAWN